MSSRKLWGELEDEPSDEESLEEVDFTPIIELGLQNIPEISVAPQTSPVVFPEPNLIIHTVQLHAYARQLSAIIAQSKRRRTFRLDVQKIPKEPVDPSKKVGYDLTSPVAFLEKKFSNFALGQGPVVVPFTAESHSRALNQCAAIAIGHVGIELATNEALTALAEALDEYMTKFCKVMRTVMDRDAAGLQTGFPDIISKVLHELQVGNLQIFYENRVIRYHEKTKLKCAELRKKCEAIAAKNPPRKPPARQQKSGVVPQLHFSAALGTSLSQSLRPGYQMLQDVEMLDVVSTTSTRPANMEFAMPGPAPKPSTSAMIPKKKKK